MGTVYCLHHDEEELIGSEPVPCPFCGFGAEAAERPGSDDLGVLGFDDSQQALRDALGDAEPSSETSRNPPGSRLRGYW